MTLPDTRHSLFVRLRDAGDHEAWREFVRIYEPAMYRFARKQGLQDADAAELAQDVLTRVVQTLPRWDPDRTRGTFRSWLFTVARTKLVDAWRAASRDAARLGTSASHTLLAELADRGQPHELETELRRQVICRAAAHIQPEFQESTWRAFVLTTVAGRGIPESARELGLTVGAVYAARSRVLARLKDCVRRLWVDCGGREEAQP